ncbi:50S ribosomal protein L19e [Candidatus Parvarchaeota archaeon]|uniref:Large ribosomal subunit protein eL19 n=1 Tax=Candidatus Acidifodinimicrobium mancum TaxID=2898728 RepID=A0A8T3UUN3_9ARCH|nr:50S ribosomal protein L19e [Candidatus Acidifodinimicrobium mancum]MBE5728945.1 50S ribosomal protein L19e [Candidatus Acidifodinimicrobium mancum]MBE5729922.1 50S ribosomal protein L19e [Candidatus Acidifodinimicrobium mancum]
MVSGLKTQRRLASEILGVGKSRVWIDPSKYKDIKSALTKEDVLNLINKGVIKKRNENFQSRGRSRELRLKKSMGKRKGMGSRKGKAHARSDFDWRYKVRALRAELRSQLEKGNIDKKTFRSLYKKVKGNSFHSVSHLRNYISETVKGKGVNYGEGK